MCRPVIVKKVAPKSGDGSCPSVVVNTCTQCSGRRNGPSPSCIKWFHSIKWRTMKAAPKNIVASIHLRAAALSPRLDADTPNTMVKLDDSRQNVMTDAKTILG